MTIQVKMMYSSYIFYKCILNKISLNISLCTFTVYIYNNFLYNLCRYTFNENRLASKKLQQKYDDKIIGKIANAIYNFH